MKKNQHVVPLDHKWAIKGAGNERYTKILDTQKEAVEKARDIAIKNKSEVVIHNRKGQIRDSDSYGNDPCPPKDKKH